MPIPMKPLRRIVTGQNSGGRSAVLYDSAAPNVNVGGVASSAGMTDIWAFPHCPSRWARHETMAPAPFVSTRQRLVATCGWCTRLRDRQTMTRLPIRRRLHCTRHACALVGTPGIAEARTRSVRRSTVPKVWTMGF